MDKATADSLISVQSFAIIKNTGNGNFAIGRFQTTEPSLCTAAPSPTDNPTAISVIMNGPPRLELGVRVSAFAFSQRLLKIDIDISVGKRILEKKYFTKRMIYQMLNCSKE